MKYLLFRTDRIGDFFVTSPLIKSIIRNNNKAEFYLVCSKNNYNLVKEFNYVKKVFILNKNNLANKINLFKTLKNENFDCIIVSDKKKRSLIYALLLNSKIKIINVSKKIHFHILKFFFKNIFLDDEKISNKLILDKNANILGFNIEKKDYNFLDNCSFENKLKFENNFDTKIFDYLVMHLDEKWEIKNYMQMFKKANNFQEINLDKKDFLNFLNELHLKTKKKIIITTGVIKTDIIKFLIDKSKKINSNLYLIDNKKILLIINVDFFSMIDTISKCKIFIGCHGSFTHVAASYGLKIIDIIDKNKLNFYKKYTNYIDDYSYVFRDDFNNLKKNIFNKI